MQLVMVECWTEQHEEDNEPRNAAVITEDADKAIELCQARYGDAGFTRFRADIVSGRFAG